MNVAPPAPAAVSTFQPVRPVGEPVAAAPPLERVRLAEELVAPETPLASVRYEGVATDDGGHEVRREVVARDGAAADTGYALGRDFQRARGSLDEAIAAARLLAVRDDWAEDPAAGTFGRTAVAVLQAGEGEWHLAQLAYPEGMGDGMDAIISMPIDPVPASRSEISIPYDGAFEQPTSVGVRFEHPLVHAVVGVDHVARRDDA